MKLALDKTRVRLFVGLGLAYYGLRIIGEITSDSDTFLASAVNHFWLVAYLIVLNFILFEFLAPYVSLNFKRILLSLILFFILMLMYSFGLQAWRYIGIQIRVYTALQSYTTPYAVTENLMSYSVSTIFFFGIIKHFYDYRNLKISTQQLRIEKQQAELNYLKSQTNPHFLFNTLNNIYSLARDKSDLTPESILRLSKILRFMLYEAGGEYISIDKELKIIGDYIELEKLRYDESLRINFNHNVENMNQALPPLILIPLVENAFKHGASETHNDPFVDIHLTVKDRQLYFTVKNSKSTAIRDQPIRENIGLSNLRRQLQLLYKDHQLELTENASIFSAQLEIDLSTHV